MERKENKKKEGETGRRRGKRRKRSEIGNRRRRNGKRQIERKGERVTPKTLGREENKSERERRTDRQTK